MLSESFYSRFVTALAVVKGAVYAADGSSACAGLFGDVGIDVSRRKKPCNLKPLGCLLDFLDGAEVAEKAFAFLDCVSIASKRSFVLSSNKFAMFPP